MSEPANELLKDELHARAAALGCARLGVAAVQPTPTGAAFAAWLARGDHGGMSWLAREVAVRLDPRARFPWAQSVIAVALRTGAPEPDAPGPSPTESGEDARGANSDPLPPPRGRVGGGGPLPRNAQRATRNSYSPVEAPPAAGRLARYARGRDYHRVFRPKLRALAALIAARIPGARTHWYVDTGPVLERAWAVAAGLGWIGKNTMLLSRTEGSATLLGVLFTSVALPAEAPVTDHCGRCTACLDACPTGALAAPFRLDARRCLSAWTIEERGALAPEARAALGDWLFGCDLCQQVCPFNRELPPAPEPGFDTRPARLPLAEILTASDDELRARFAGTPLLRAKPAGLRRNALYAAANSGDRRLYPLAAALQDSPDPVVRDAARDAAARLRNV